MTANNGSAPSRGRVVMVSFLVDLFDVATNLVVAIVTGSAVVFAEMAQGVADSVGSGLLVVGDRRSSRPVDPEHPQGYRREAFFWAVLSALAMLFIGAGLSAWRGIGQLTDPAKLDNSPLAIAVLTVAIVTNSYAVMLSVRNLKKHLKITMRGCDVHVRNCLSNCCTNILVALAVVTCINVVRLASLQAKIHSLISMIHHFPTPTSIIIPPSCHQLSGGRGLFVGVCVRVWGMYVPSFR